MKNTWLIVVIVIFSIVMVFGPTILRKVTWKKIVDALGHKDFDSLYKIIDSKACKLAYPPFNREYMRLNGYLAQENDAKVEKQLKALLDMNASSKQKGSVYARAFYYYLEKGKSKDAEKMLSKGKGVVDEATYQNMQMQFSILVKEEAKYIKECQKMLDSIWDGKSALSEKDKVPVGIIQYMIGLQYSYLKDKENQEKYFSQALEKLKSTDYEQEINKILKKEG